MTNFFDSKNQNMLFRSIYNRTNLCMKAYLNNYEILEGLILENHIKNNLLKEEGYDQVKEIIDNKYQILLENLDGLNFKIHEYNTVFKEINTERIYEDKFDYNISQLNSIELKLDLLKSKILECKSTIKTNQDSPQQKKYATTNIINELTQLLNVINSDLINVFEGISHNSNVINNEITINLKEKKDNDNKLFQKRFNEETALLIKKYDQEFKNLSESFKNQIQSLRIDNEAVSESNKLLKNETDQALKKLANLNERTQKIELEYSNIIKSESEKIKKEIQVTKGNIAEDINTLFNEVNDQINAIKTTHSDLLGLVEKAGIYELTKNYKEKADEEKIEYKDYRKYTSWSIIAAIVSTIAVFAFAFWEQSQLPDNSVVNTNYLLLVSRLSISLMFFVLALYLSKQASKHYECYQENHRTFLQLAALEPFMARMTQEEQKEIRKGLIPSYFNQSNDGKYASKGDEVDLSSNMTNIFNKLIEKIPSKNEEPDPKTPEKTTS